MMGEFFDDDSPHGKVKRIMWFKFLQAFIAKTQQSRDKIDKTIICDVFAGPGIYESHGWSPVFTDYGSPLVALRAAIGYFMRKNKLNKTFEPISGATVSWTCSGPDMQELECYKIDFYFVEKDGNNYKSLVDNIILFFDFHDISNFGISYPQVNGQCKHTYVYSTDECFPIRCFIYNCEFVDFPAPDVPDNERMVTFIDPFGFAMIPWEAVCNFVGEHKDLFINLMTSFMHRFFRRNRDKIGEVFGIDPEVLQTLRDEDKSNFVDTLAELYVEKLETSSDYALTFEVRKKNNARLFHLIFATSHIKGLKAMKESFNRGTQEDDDFSISDFKVLIKGIPLNFRNKQVPKQVANVIFDKFKGRHNVSIMDIERFVWLGTQYVYRKGPLAIMQRDGRIEEVIGRNDEPQERRNTFPDHDDTEWLISFKSSE